MSGFNPFNFGADILIQLDIEVVYLVKSIFHKEA